MATATAVSHVMKLSWDDWAASKRSSLTPYAEATIIESQIVPPPPPITSGWFQVESLVCRFLARLSRPPKQKMRRNGVIAEKWGLPSSPNRN